MRKPTLKSAKERAWKAISAYVRARDRWCVTCGSVKDLQAGHFHHNVLDFDEININAQCTHCNKYKHGNLADYACYLIRKYGLKAFQDLDQRHWVAIKVEYRTIQDYLDIEAKYKKLLVTDLDDLRQKEN